jgi:hypothetical protein
VARLCPVRLEAAQRPLTSFRWADRGRNRFGKCEQSHLAGSRRHSFRISGDSAAYQAAQQRKVTELSSDQVALVPLNQLSRVKTRTAPTNRNAMIPTSLKWSINLQFFPIVSSPLLA